MIFIAYVAIEMDTRHPHVNFLGKELRRKEMKPKVEPMTKRKVNHLNLLIMLWHVVILETKDLFNASLASWKNDWLLDSGATCHMNFRRDFFE